MTMTPGKWFALALIALNLGAAGGYCYVADWRRCVYWIAAAVLTICVTF